MRIISGIHKGRKIIAPKNLLVRPTTNFAKESLFNILSNYYRFSEVSLLDLFAGTGNISYEFASREGFKITAVDRHYACVQFIHKISKKFHFNIHTVKADVFKYLESTSKENTIIFADPPYSFKKEELKNVIKKIFSRKLLKKEGMLVLEHGTQVDLSTESYFSFKKKYGGCVFSFFEYSNTL